MVKLFEIVLEPSVSSKGYLSGSKLSGKLVVETGEAKSYKEIQISLAGTGKVEWSAGDGEDGETHRAREEYVQESATLWSSASAEEEEQSGKLSEGRHEFPFTFSIPVSCPSSYETKRGSARFDAWVRYVLTGRIITHGALKADHTVEKSVPVRKVVAIERGSLLEPVKQWTQESECCLCCVSAPVVITIELPRSGFAIGEKIPLTVSLENGSGRNVRVETALARRVMLKARAHVLRKPLHSVVRERSDPIRARSTTTWNPQTLTVPDIEATMETPGGMISVAYELSVHVGLLFGRSVDVSVPIVIGDIASSGGASQSVASTTTHVAGRTVSTEQYQPWES